MSPEAKDKLLGTVVEQLLAAAANMSEGDTQMSAGRRRARVRVPGMRPVPAAEDDDQSHSLVAALFLDVPPRIADS
jgi:hypothetical protein